MQHLFAQSDNTQTKKPLYITVKGFCVVPAGIEPATQGFSVLCSTNWAMVPKNIPPLEECKCSFFFHFWKLFSNKIGIYSDLKDFLLNMSNLIFINTRAIKHHKSTLYWPCFKWFRTPLMYLRCVFVFLYVLTKVQRKE